MLNDQMMDGMGAMMPWMGGGMLLVATLLVAIGFAAGYAVARKRGDRR